MTMTAEEMFTQLLDRVESATQEATAQRHRADRLQQEAYTMKAELDRVKPALAARNDEVGKLQARVRTLEFRLQQAGAPVPAPGEVDEVPF